MAREEGWRFRFTRDSDGYSDSRTSEAYAVATNRGRRLLWSHERLDPANPNPIDHLPSYLRTAMEYSVRDWRRHRVARGTWDDLLPPGQGDPNLDDPDTKSAEIRDPWNDPEAWGLALEQVALLQRLLDRCAEQLTTHRNGKGKAALFRLWVEAKLSRETLTQAQLGNRLGISQPTVHRWLLPAKLELAPLLGNPHNDLTPRVRDAAFSFFLADQPETHNDTGEAEPPADPQTDDPTGDDHD